MLTYKEGVPNDPDVGGKPVFCSECRAETRQQMTMSKRARIFRRGTNARTVGEEAEL